jgi:hypothetical protein
VAPDTAVPQSACFKAGASFTPSPVIATRCPRCCSALTMAYLCSGKTRANPSAASIASAIAGGTWSGSMCGGNASAAGMMLVPSPSWRAISRAIAVSSPVTILMRTPLLSARSIVARESSRGGSNIGRMPSSAQVFPPSPERATASARYPLPARSATSFSTLPADVGRWLCERNNGLRGALGDRERRSPRVSHRRLRPLRHRVEWHEIRAAIRGKCAVILQRRDDRVIDGVASVGLRGKRAGEDDLLGALGRQQDRLTQGELVLGQGAGLVRAEDIDAGHLLDRRQPRDDRLLLRQGERAQRHGDGEHRRHRHRDRRHQQDQHELQNVQCVRNAPIVGDDDVAIDAHGHHDQREREGEGDEKVSDLEHRPLSVAHGTGAGDELGGTPEKRVRPGGNDRAAHFTLLDDAARVSFVAQLLGDRQRLAGQRGLIDENVSLPEQAQVGRHDHAEADVRDVARHQGRGVDGLVFAVPQHRRVERKAFLQRGERVGGFDVLPEFQARVEQQKAGNDGEIVPAPEQGRHDRGGFDHVGHRTGEMLQDLPGETGLRLRQGVGPVLRQSFPSSVFGQALVRRHVETREHLCDRHGLEVGGMGGP